MVSLVSVCDPAELRVPLWGSGGSGSRLAELRQWLSLPVIEWLSRISEQFTGTLPKPSIISHSKENGKRYFASIGGTHGALPILYTNQWKRQALSACLYTIPQPTLYHNQLKMASTFGATKASRRIPSTFFSVWYHYTGFW